MSSPASPAARTDGTGTDYLRRLAASGGPVAPVIDVPGEVVVPRLIGFGGWARSGKDTTAEILVREYGHRLLSFGTYVAALLVEINPWIEVGPGQFERAADLLERLGYEGAKQIPDFVRALQELGTAINRRDGGLWARLVLADLPPDGLGVITGVRSKAQITAIRDHGGLTIWVSRPGVKPRNAHINELEVGPDDFDVVLSNDGDRARLARNLHALFAAR